MSISYSTIVRAVAIETFEMPVRIAVQQIDFNFTVHVNPHNNPRGVLLAQFLSDVMTEWADKADLFDN